MTVKDDREGKFFNIGEKIMVFFCYFYQSKLFYYQSLPIQVLVRNPLLTDDGPELHA